MKFPVKYLTQQIFICLSLTAGAVCLLSLQNLTASQYVENFDAGSQGWQYGYGTGYTIGSTYHTASGGNSDAHIYGDASDLYAIWIDSWGTTDSLIPYGDMTGWMLTIDTKSVGMTTGTAQIYIGKNGTYFVAVNTWDISLDTDWTTHTTTLNDVEFNRWQPSTTMSLAAVLQAPDDIGIFFGASTVTANTGAQILVDNFGTLTPSIVAIPEPSPIVILSLCATGILFHRKKTNRIIGVFIHKAKQLESPQWRRPYLERKMSRNPRPAH